MNKLTPKYEVLIDGSAAPRELVEAIITLTCRLDLEKADMIELRLSNPDLRWTDSDSLSEGKKLSISMGYVETDLQLVATGKIVRRECEFPERGPAVVTVIAYDERHLLKHKVESRTWKDVKDSDVVSQLCQAAGLQAEVDDTGTTEPYLFQNAQTNMAFIRERAMRLGYEVFMDAKNEKLHFKKPRDDGSSALTLKWGETLFEFSPRFSTSDVVSEITVRGWDPKKKEPIVATVSSDQVGSTLGVARNAAAAAQKYGSRQTLWVGTPSSTGDAQAMAKSWLKQRLLHFAEGTGLCQGQNTVRPGVIVKIEGTGARAKGDYYVTSALHELDHRGYRTFFEFQRPGSHSPVEAQRQIQPASPRPAPAPEEPTFVEFEIRETGDAVAPGTPYTVTLPDGRQVKGKLDESRVIRVEGVKTAGDCKIELELEDGTRLLG